MNTNDDELVQRIRRDLDTSSYPRSIDVKELVVIPDLIRDPVPRRHWIAGQARNDSRRPQYHARNDKPGVCNDKRLSCFGVALLAWQSGRFQVIGESRRCHEQSVR